MQATFPNTLIRNGVVCLISMSKVKLDLTYYVSSESMLKLKLKNTDKNTSEKT